MPLGHKRHHMTNVELCRLNPNLPFCKLIPQEQFVPAAGGGGGGFETRNDIASRDTRTAAVRQEAPQVFIPPDPSTLKEVAKKVGFAPKDDVKPETTTETPLTDVRTRMDGIESLAETDPRIERVATEARGPVPSDFPAIPQEARFQSQNSEFMGIRKSASLDTRTTATSGDMDFRSALRRDFGSQAAAKDGTVAERIDATETPPTVVRGPRPLGPRLFSRAAQRGSKLEDLSKYEPEYRSVLRNQFDSHLTRGGPRAIDTGERGFVERFNSAFAPETETELATRNNMAMMNRGLPQPSEAAAPDVVAPPPAAPVVDAAAGAEAAETAELEGIAEVAAF